jgi:hypothetical protein
VSAAGTLERCDEIAIVRIDPPVNALRAVVEEGTRRALVTAIADTGTRGGILNRAGLGPIAELQPEDRQGLIQARARLALFLAHEGRRFARLSTATPARMSDLHHPFSRGLHAHA